MGTKQSVKPVVGACDPREGPTIACFHRATVPLGVDLDKLIRAMQQYVDQNVAPVWGTPAKLVKSTDFVPGAWAMVFLDNADQPGALAYHDLTPDGLPEAKIFVKTTLANHDLVSIAASHQLVEMLVDPATNMMTTGPDATALYAYESADPVEEVNYLVGGLAMSNFVYPAYFETFHKPRSVQFDHLKKIKQPFEVLPGGYQTVLKHGKWTQTFGSPEKAARFAREDRRGHRGEQREARHLKPADVHAIAHSAGR